jgi:hypothetical protein
MTILAGTEYGIRADSTVDNLVIACDYLSGWTAEGILLEKSGSPSLYFNTIASPSASGVSGVHLSDVTGAVAKNNIIWNRGLDSSACYRIDGTFPFVPGATDYNDLYATGANGSTARVDNNWYPTLADWRGHSSSPDGHSIAEDPLFDSLGDYHIQAGSPCRNSGIAIAGIDTDLEGETRDSLPDIGADEYVPPAVAEGEFKIPDSRLQILPNPVTSGFAVLHWNPRILDPSAPVSLRVFDATGRCFLTQALGVGRGASSVNLDLRGLSAGVHLVRLTAGAGTATLKLVRN